MSNIPGRSTASHQHSPSLWSNHDYVLFWSGQTISSVGGSISLLAFPLLTLTLTGSALQASLVTAFRTLPRLFCLLFAGALVDRWNRKWVMMICDIGRTASVLSIPLVFLSGHLTIWQLSINALLEGTLQSFFEVAYSSGLAQIVRSDQLSSAMAQEEVVEGITGLLGPALSGALFSVMSGLLPFLADAISYSVSIVTLSLIRTPFQLPRMPKRRHLLHEICEGFVWMWRQSVLRAMNSINSVVALVVPGSTVVILVVARQQHATPLMIGIIMACGGVGAVLGSLLSPFGQRFLTVGHSILVVRWVFALAWPLYAFMPHPLLLGVVEFIIGFADPFEDVPYFSYRLAIIPDALRGRVISACRLFTSLSNPLGLVITGWSLEHLGATHTILFGSCVLCVTALIISCTASLRNAKHADGV
ncbi:MAG: MFS transporter [Ktedonobacteraceae bacterium]|nr:MFS transporter [Ktedonobacteraceae bacterium]